MKIKKDDEVVETAKTLALSYEDTKVNIALSYDGDFHISVFDRQHKIMRYYDVVDGVMFLDEEEQL